MGSQDLQQARYDQLIRRVGGLYGGGSKVVEVLPELFPTIDLENIPAELLWLAGIRIGVGTATVLPIVGEIAKVQLFNPAGSLKLVTVTSLGMSMNANDELRWGVFSNPLATNVGNVVYRDTRTGIAVVPTTQVRSDSAPGGITAEWQTRVLAETQVLLSDRNGIAVLAPGTGLTAATTSTNRRLVVNFLWRERQALESELNFP